MREAVHSQWIQEQTGKWKQARRLLSRAHLTRVHPSGAGFWVNLEALEASGEAYTPNHPKYPFVSY